MNDVPAQTEREFQDAVVELATLAGWMTYHTHDSRRSNPGFPDLVMVRNGRLIFAELKSEQGRVLAEQRVWLDALNNVPAKSGTTAVHVVLWRPSDWSDIEMVLR